MSSLIPHDYRYKISSPTPVDKEPKSTLRVRLFELERVKRIELSQSAWKAEVLPLNYTRILGRLMGIEPTNVGATIRCVNHFATIAMAGVAGIEPTLTVLETAVLPLNYTPIYLVPEAGLEPATY